MNKLTLAPLLLSLALAASVTACDNDPGKDKAKAAVTEPAQTASVTAAAASAPVAAAQGAAPVAAAAAPALAGVKYAFSQADSKVQWTGAKITGKHEGSFEGFTGAIGLVDNAPEKSSVTVDIDTATLKTDPEKLVGHLKSGDFFDVAKFPKAKFTSTAIKAGGEKGATHTVTGNLELHGVTKGITFPATIKVAGDTVNVNAEFVINRKDFGLVYPGKPDDLIKDDVAIKLTLAAKKAQ
jgi:polyisoprenoid-binding protein YceI